MILLLLLGAFWDLGNGKHFVISVLVFETVISHFLNCAFHVLIPEQVEEEGKRGGSKG